MAQDDVEIKVVDQTTATDNQQIEYLPFGVKVLKVRVRRNPVTRPGLGPIWVHPANYERPAADGDPAHGRVYGTADDDPDLWVAWGAGDEAGFCVKTSDPFGFSKSPAPLDDDGDYYLYLHLIHRPADPLAHIPSPRTLTLIASSESAKGVVAREANGQIKVFGRLAVQLTPPAGAERAIRASWRWDAAGQSIIAFNSPAGQDPLIARYVSRWWPGRQVIYEPATAAELAFISSLRVIYQRRHNNQDASALEVRHGDQTLARFSGDLSLPLHDARLATAELQRFTDGHHLVLRLWFYWLHLALSEDDLLAYLPADQRAGGRAEAQRVRAAMKGGFLSTPWAKLHEIPDVERFDLILDPDKLGQKFVGTDIHWQEYWSKVTEGQPLAARIATLSDIPDVVKNGTQVPKVEGPAFNPLANGLCDYVNETSGRKCPNRPGDGDLITVTDIEPGDNFDACPVCGTHVVGEGARAKGKLWAKHPPLLAPENAEVLEGAVSTNVLHG